MIFTRPDPVCRPIRPVFNDAKPALVARQNSPPTFASARASYLPLRRSILLAGGRLWVMVAPDKDNLATTSGNGKAGHENSGHRLGRHDRPQAGREAGT
jgi:hypothetical protein